MNGSVYLCNTGKFAKQIKIKAVELYNHYDCSLGLNELLYAMYDLLFLFLILTCTFPIDELVDKWDVGSQNFPHVICLIMQNKYLNTICSYLLGKRNISILNFKVARRSITKTTCHDSCVSKIHYINAKKKMRPCNCTVVVRVIFFRNLVFVYMCGDWNLS